MDRTWTTLYAHFTAHVNLFGLDAPQFSFSSTDPVILYDAIIFKTAANRVDKTAAPYSLFVKYWINEIPYVFITISDWFWQTRTFPFNSIDVSY